MAVRGLETWLHIIGSMSTEILPLLGWKLSWIICKHLFSSSKWHSKPQWHYTNIQIYSYSVLWVRRLFIWVCPRLALTEIHLHVAITLLRLDIRYIILTNWRRSYEKKLWGHFMYLYIDPPAFHLIILSVFKTCLNLILFMI